MRAPGFLFLFFFGGFLCVFSLLLLHGIYKIVGKKLREKWLYEGLI